MRFLVMCTQGSGGTWPPVVAIAKSLVERGHRVLFFAEASLCAMCQFEESEVVPSTCEFTYFYDRWLKQCRLDKTLKAWPAFLETWASAASPGMKAVIEDFQPHLLITCFSCVALAEKMSACFSIPWCLINPAFYFGEGAKRSIAEDFSPYAAEGIAAYYPPRLAKADLVLHTTSSYFDLPPKALPSGHSLSGFLYWEQEKPVPTYLRRPGNPWVLYSPSTAEGEDDSWQLQNLIKAFSGRPLRLLITHPQAQQYQYLACADKVFIEPPLPHSQVMPHCHYYLGPAGHGTVNKCLIFGLPMLLWNAGVDQSGVCFRAKRLGVAVQIENVRFSVSQISEALDRFMANPLLVSRALQIKQFFQKENQQAKERSCDAIERTLKINGNVKATDEFLETPPKHISIKTMPCE